MLCLQADIKCSSVGYYVCFDCQIVERVSIYTKDSPLISAPNQRTPGAGPNCNLIKHPLRVLSKCLRCLRFVCLKLFHLCLHPTLCLNTGFVVVNKSRGMFRLSLISPECVSSGKCNYCIDELTLCLH